MRVVTERLHYPFCVVTERLQHTLYAVTEYLQRAINLVTRHIQHAIRIITDYARSTRSHVVTECLQQTFHTERLQDRLYGLTEHLQHGFHEANSCSYRTSSRRFSFIYRPSPTRISRSYRTKNTMTYHIVFSVVYFYLKKVCRQNVDTR